MNNKKQYKPIRLIINTVNFFQDDTQIEICDNKIYFGGNRYRLVSSV